MRDCKRCEEAFEPKTKYGKVCEYCKLLPMNQQTTKKLFKKVCRRCQEEYIPYGKYQKYCDDCNINLNKWKYK